MTTSRRILGAVAAAGAAALVLSGCVAKSDVAAGAAFDVCLLYTSPSPRDS